MALCRAISMLKNKLTYKKTYVVPTVSFEEIEVGSVMNVQGSIGNATGDQWDEDPESKGFRGDFVFEQNVFEDNMVGNLGE